jgi:hypothetical protein
MNEKEEKYPQLILKTDGTYEILIEEGVSVSCNTKEAIDRFTKNKNFMILGRTVYKRRS